MAVSKLIVIARNGIIFVNLNYSKISCSKFLNENESIFQPPQKGKQATKGAKQIVEENVATLKFYRNMSLGSSVLFLVAQLCFFDLFSGLTIVGLVAYLMLTD